MPNVPALPALSPRFFLALGLVGLTIGSLGLSLVYGPASAAVLGQLRGLRYHDATFRYFAVPGTAAGFRLLRWGLLALSATSGLAVLALARRGGLLRREAAALAQEWRAAAPLLARWRQLAGAERRTALGLFLGLTLLRAYWVVQYPLYGDELVTYLSFVRPGPVAATGFYPIPNNHVLYSLLCWLFSTVSPNFYWVMRLPTFLIGTLGTALVGLWLLRRYGVRVAAWAVLLGGLFPYALFQSVVGRGYGLLAVCGQLGLLATLALADRPAQSRRAWVVWVGSSVAGCYAVPTYLLNLVGLVALLAWWQRPNWGRLALAGAVVGALTLLLYAPVLVVSGPGALLHNAYVAPGAGHVAGLTPWAFAQRTEGQLLGVGALALPLLLLLTAGALAAGRWWPLVRPLQHLLLAAAVLLWLPYALLAARAVYPPARVLAYREFYGLLLVLPLVAVAWRTWRPPAWLGRPAVALALPVLLAAAAVLVPFQRRAAPDALLNNHVAQTHRWLRQHGATHVLANHAHYQLYLVFFNQQANGNLTVDASPQPGRRYDFQLLDKDGQQRPRPGATPKMETAEVQVWQLPR